MTFIGFNCLRAESSSAPHTFDCKCEIEELKIGTEHVTKDDVIIIIESTCLVVDDLERHCGVYHVQFNRHVALLIDGDVEPHGEDVGEIHLGELEEEIHNGNRVVFPLTTVKDFVGY